MVVYNCTVAYIESGTMCDDETVEFTFYDYFSGKEIGKNEVSPKLTLGAVIDGADESQKCMVFAISRKDKEAAVGPVKMVVGNFYFNFVDGRFFCSRCKMTSAIGVKEAFDHTWQKKTWPHAFDISRTIKFMKLLETSHAEMCDLVVVESPKKSLDIS